MKLYAAKALSEPKSTLKVEEGSAIKGLLGA